MWKFIRKIFEPLAEDSPSHTTENPELPMKKTKRKIEDVAIGERIVIEYKRFANNGIGGCTCLNNIPDERKIYVRISWGNYIEIKCEQFHDLILSYDGKELQNFALLNPVQEEPVQEEKKVVLKYDKNERITGNKAPDQN